MKVTTFGLLCMSMTSVGLGAKTLWVQHLVVPEYPSLARMARLQGTVTIEVEIGRDGKVVEAKAHGAHPLLQRESEKNLRQWTFHAEPGAPDSVMTHATITYVYKLGGKEMYHQPVPTVVMNLPDRVEITTNPPEPQP
jgi:TonB family protein